MTDHHTDDLFSSALEHGGTLFINKFSRLVVDPERFPNDQDEPMSVKGMGAVYTHTSSGARLRALEFVRRNRNAIMNRYFYPYSRAIEELVSGYLDKFGMCLILDGHSFPSIPLPYEDASLKRPDICLGYDSFHDPCRILPGIISLVNSFGWICCQNEPFSGSYVPLRYFRQDSRVKSLMIEIKRNMYMDESTASRLETYLETRRRIDQIISFIAEELKN